MLRKGSSSIQKDQNNMGYLTNSDANSENYSKSHDFGRNIKGGNSIFNIPCLFVGLGPKGFLDLDSDSVRSPTSPLDTKVLSNLGNPVRNQRSSLFEGNQRSWDCCKVGLSIVESLEDCNCSRFCRKTLQMMIKTTPICETCMDSFESSKMLPKDFCTQNESLICKNECESNVLFEIGETSLELDESIARTRSCSMDSCKSLKAIDSDIDDFDMKDVAFQVSVSPHFIGGSENSNAFASAESKPNTLSICSSDEILKSLSASEIELSEDYTCVISHGPNPKTTHIFCDCVLETHPKHEKEKVVTLIGKGLQTPNQFPSNAFLSFCHHCDKKLEEGKDIYIYRGEKAFCSLACREMAIMIDEELEKSNSPRENSPKPKPGEQIFETGIPTII